MGVTSKAIHPQQVQLHPPCPFVAEKPRRQSYCSVSQTTAPQATLRDCAKGSIIRPSRAVRLQAHPRDSQRGQNRLSRPNRPKRKATGWKPHNAAFADFAGVQLHISLCRKGTPACGDNSGALPRVAAFAGRQSQCERGRRG